MRGRRALTYDWFTNPGRLGHAWVVSNQDLWVAILGGALAACTGNASIGSHDLGDAGVKADAQTCVLQESTETHCSDGIDNDCNGFADCLDPACAGQSCGGGLTCMAGGCMQPCDPDAGMCLPTLPALDNVVATTHGDTVTVTFEPVSGGLDYRIYPMPDPNDVLVGASGHVTVRNAIYRCAGDRPYVSRENFQSGGFAQSLSGEARGYKRVESESVLGYVYVTPGPGRLPVYHVSSPDLQGGYVWEYSAPPTSDSNGAEYVTDAAQRTRLVAQGWRDDGIAFYVDPNGTRPIYRREYVSDSTWGRTVVFYSDGAEHDARAKDAASAVADFGARFNVLAAAGTGTVPLHRVFYTWANDHDVLVAGEARYQWVLHQGNQPLASVSWPGITGPTTFVVEALDTGCPFPGGYIGYAHAASTGTNNAPTITVDEARLPISGEVFINGEHDPMNRPTPIARSFVNAAPQAFPTADWSAHFNPGDTWVPPPLVAGDSNNGVFVYRDGHFSAEFAGCTPNHSFGPVLGQLVVGGGDGGSSCNMHIAARGVASAIASDHYLHVSMATDISSTMRRYPQILITTVQVADPSSVQHQYDVPVGSRLGPFPYQHLPPGTDRSIVVQPFGLAELQIEFCDLRGWGVSQQCPRANIYGYHAGDYQDTWKSPWVPVPVLGDMTGWDRPVQFDVYASTDRVYSFIDGKPGGCAVLPAGRMPAGPVTVLFGSVGYHMDIDESVIPMTSGQGYLRTYSQNHIDRHMDDFSIQLSAPLPQWDETRLPCGTRWYGGS
jgi:hypothetical protein